MDREKRFHIADEKVEAYIRNTLRPFSGAAGEILKEATAAGVPVATAETARLLEIISLALRPKKILELGAAAGFTSILMAESLAEGGVIDTIEIDPESAAGALSNFKRAGVSGRINIIVGDALDVLENLDKKYDLIFIDAAKGQYTKYFEFCSDMVNMGGVIFADNVLYRGMTAGGAKINRRQQLLVRRLREFLGKVINDERFTSDILSIGDGVCISYRNPD